jgi:N-ethylmaleimide reductase
MANLLFGKYKLGNIELNNRVVMAPMTRSRAINNTPNNLIAEYYKQRSGAGLIVTEGTSPSPNGLGYSRIPGLFNKTQVEGWKEVTDAVHANGGHIFVQLMHTGRVGHPLNLPEGAVLQAPSAVGIKGEIWTDQKQLQPYPVPKEMTPDEIAKAKEEYVNSAKLAVEAGFDGVELHAANGYLMEQFINPSANKRNDIYGGSAENRIRFVVETAVETAAAIGAGKVGIRVSPYGAANDMAAYEGLEETYSLLAEKLNEIGIAYIHIVDHSAMGAPAVSPSVKAAIRSAFKNTVILSGGYNAEKAEKDLQDGKGDLIAFGRPFISNPNLVEKLADGRKLNDYDMNSFYTPDANGYTDYPLN